MLYRLCLCIIICFLLWGCEETTPEVVVYTALDRGFSEPILKKFEDQTGIRVRAKYDTESTKTVGLTACLIEEKARPRCDVFWNNEVLNTIRLQKEDVLQKYQSRSAAVIPELYKDPEFYWTGFAARARVLIVNTNLVQAQDYPKSIFDLALPKWKGKVGMARPIAGTTASHVAYLFASLGEEKAKEFLAELKNNNISLESGNKSCARKVAAGELHMALTDTDDAIIEIREKQPVAIVYLDIEPKQLGTLFIPNSLSLIKNCPNPEMGKKLIDFLLSPEVESMLAQCPSAQIPLNPSVKAELPTQIATPQKIQTMTVRFAEAADWWTKSRDYITQHFLK